MATETRKPTAAIAPFGLRMQPDLRERIEAAAEAAGRSMNAEIVARLEDTFLIDAGGTPQKATEFADQIVQQIVERVDAMRRELEATRRAMDVKVQALETENLALRRTAKGAK